MVNRRNRKPLKAKFIFAGIAVILIVSLTANLNLYFQETDTISNIAYLQRQSNGLQTQIANDNNQISQLLNETENLESQTTRFEKQIANLQNQTNDLKTENSELQTNNSKLQSQLSSLSEETIPPRLVTRLGATDMRFSYPGQSIRLYISGEVWNVGATMAENCSLHAILYQGSAVAKDTYVLLGDIAGGSFTDVTANIYYTGIALTNWTIIPENK